MTRARHFKTFSEIFSDRVLQSGLQPDPAQQRLASDLDRIYQLMQSRKPSAKDPGLYIWGPVGRGKTYLMDLLFEHLPAQALRLHFHRFMSHIHQRLRALQGNKDPLSLIASELSGQYRLICFDEFFINDIADAMILGRLLERLFKHNVLLISTSNRPPDQLCRDPLFEDRMGPMIRLIMDQMQVHHMNGETDHRLRQLTPGQSYYQVPESGADCPLQQRYTEISQRAAHPAQVSILGRRIPVLAIHDRCIWFSFDSLCQGARSQLDYIELANNYQHILISDVPPMGSRASEQIKARGTEDGSVAVMAGQRQVILGRMDDSARRFISLVDELYDRQVNLSMTTLVPVEQLYTEGTLLFEFERTHSRLTEMQSVEYQQRPHRSDAQDSVKISVDHQFT